MAPWRRQRQGITLTNVRHRFQRPEGQNGSGWQGPSRPQPATGWSAGSGRRKLLTARRSIFVGIAELASHHQRPGRDHTGVRRWTRTVTCVVAAGTPSTRTSRRTVRSPRSRRRSRHREDLHLPRARRAAPGAAPPRSAGRASTSPQSRRTALPPAGSAPRGDPVGRAVHPDAGRRHDRDGLWVHAVLAQADADVVRVRSRVCPGRGLPDHDLPGLGRQLFVTAQHAQVTQESACRER